MFLLRTETLVRCGIPHNCKQPIGLFQSAAQHVIVLIFYNGHSKFYCALILHGDSSLGSVLGR